MLERDRKPRLSVQPPIRDKADVVVGRNGLEHRNGDGDVVFVRGVALAEDKGVVEEDDFAVDVFDEDVEGFGAAVHFGVPLEVGGDGEVDAEERAGDGLDLGVQPFFFIGSSGLRGHGNSKDDVRKLGELVYESMNPSSLLRQPKQLSNLRRTKIKVPIPGLNVLISIFPQSPGCKSRRVGG